MSISKELIQRDDLLSAIGGSARSLCDLFSDALNYNDVHVDFKFEQMKFLVAKVLLLVFLIGSASCGEDIPDCPNKLCVLAGGWRLVEVYVDGVKDTSTDISQYRLTLYTPDPTTDIISNFDRTNPSGRQDQGTWQLENQDDVLVLMPDQSPQEDYIIKYFSPRELRLVVQRDVNKTGPEEVEFVLEPF